MSMSAYRNASLRLVSLSHIYIYIYIYAAMVLMWLNCGDNTVPILTLIPVSEQVLAGRGGRSGRVWTSRPEGPEFESRPSENNDLQNCYFFTS